MKMKVRCISIILYFLFILGGCELTTNTGSSASSASDSDISEVSNLFVDSSGEIVFQCNDINYWSSYGYTLWGLCANQSNQGAFVTRTVKVSKASGNDDAGYGIILCHGENSDGDVTMFTIMINENGYYTVGKVINARYVSIIGWTYSSYLLKNGAVNTISVSYDLESSLYNLSLNNVETCNFSDEDGTVNATGSNGYIVVISPHDDFPSDVVEVHFIEE